MNRTASIIMPAFNSAGFVGRAIESVLAQTYEDWELLVVDDCSSDNTPAVIGEYAKREPRIRVTTLDSNQGAAKARNLAIRASSGRFIAFLDSDDIWMPNKLELQIDFMSRNAATFSFASAEMVRESGEKFADWTVSGTRTYEDTLKRCEVQTSTAMYDTFALGKVFMPDIRRRQDLALWLSILKRTKYGYAIEDKLAIYMLRSGSLSRNKAKAAYWQWKVYRDVEAISVLKSLYYLGNYAYHGFIKYYRPRPLARR